MVIMTTISQKSLVKIQEVIKKICILELTCKPNRYYCIGNIYSGSELLRVNMQLPSGSGVFTSTPLDFTKDYKGGAHHLTLYHKKWVVKD